MSASCRYCCKSLFALVIKFLLACTRDFRVKIWGTSSPEDKLAGDLGNAIEATSIGGRRSDFFTAEKLAAGNLGLLQQYLPQAAVSDRSKKSLFDHIASLGEHHRRQLDAEGLGSF